MTYEDKVEKIVDFIKSGEKDEKDFKVGFEVEHFVVDKNSLETVRYEGENGIRQSLEELKDLGYEGIYEGEYIMGLHKDGASISIEPAAQFEISLDSQNSIDKLFETYKKTMAEIIPIFDKKGQLLVEVGYQVKDKIADIPRIPKDRYKFMYEYFEKYAGPMAHNMMKGSASLQVAIDYSDEDDFRKKYFLANALTPFFYSIFDNAYIFEGEVYENHNIRQTIWENCDKDRTGIYPFSFDNDLSYEKYAKKILATPSIFIKKDGKDIATNEKTFEEIFDQDMSDEMVFHALSIVFPDVRVKKYIEIRMPDNLPFPYNFAAVSLIKNIFYDKEVLDYAYNLLAGFTYQKAQDLKKITVLRGIQAMYEDKKIYEWMLEIIGKIKEDRKYIDPLKDLLEEQKTPRDLYEELYKESPQRAIYEFSVNKFVKDNNGEN
ncbi:glutamate-cysteine ligase family protein [Anaerococcus sp. Marseille-P9784]|uniref:glutamate-cysteine ligase family protein n=1 Tax=Anaerococcus sp. Marseille-P9784 TaxID=2614127 RepID=UPI001249CEE1|nr:glutamate-cysteine ligase family protein [Anaerococcus sp. Marseille-P9784]